MADLKAGREEKARLQRIISTHIRKITLRKATMLESQEIIIILGEGHQWLLKTAGERLVENRMFTES